MISCRLQVYHYLRKVAGRFIGYATGLVVCLSTGVNWSDISHAGIGDIRQLPARHMVPALNAIGAVQYVSDNINLE